MDGYLILKKRYVLRGWTGTKHGITDTANGETLFLPGNVYDTLRFCNGRFEEDSPVFFGQRKEHLKAFLEGTKLTVAAAGKLGTTSAPELEKAVKNNINGVTELVFDFEKLEYMASAGLRVLLSAAKVMKKQRQHEDHKRYRTCNGGLYLHRYGRCA